MNTIESFLQEFANLLSKLDGAPAAVLVLLGCITIGYILKCWKSFSNQLIPPVVILLGAIFYPVIADSNNDIPLRVWIIRNVFIGLIIGLASWLLHNKILSKLEDRLGLFAEQKQNKDEP